MKIDFIADLVCPWCYLGWRALVQAMERRPGIAFDVHWRAYQLDPSVPEGGVDRAAYMAARYPDRERMAGVHAALKGMAAELGAVLHTEAISVTPNTSAGHRLIRWAGEAGRARPVIDALFSAYFVEGRDIGAPLVIAGIGDAAGIPRLLVLERLSEGLDAEAVAIEHRTAAEAGVTGVPFVVFGERFGVAGAQSPERYLLAIDKLAASATANGGD